MNFTLRQLKIFNAVARHLSFTRASEELHLTQSAVSMQIKQLEQEAGVNRPLSLRPCPDHHSRYP